MDIFLVLVKLSIYLNIFIRSMDAFTCSGGAPIPAGNLSNIDAAI